MTKQEKHLEWLELRRSGIGGSDISAILGMNPWTTPVDVYTSKVNPPDAEDKGNLAMRIGTELEDLVAKLFEEQTGKSVERYNKTIQDGILLGNVDRLVVPAGSKVASHKGEIRATEGVECKTSSDLAWAEIPLHYQLQCQWYMGLIPSLTKMYVPVLFLKYKDFRIYELERDQAVIDKIQDYARKWWAKHVEAGVCPEATTYTEASDLYPKSRSASVVATDEVLRAVVSLGSINEQIKALEEQAAKEKTTICKFLKDNDTLTNNQGMMLATWKTNKDSLKVDYKGVVKELNPDKAIIEKYTTTQAGARVFKIKTTKE